MRLLNKSQSAKALRIHPYTFTRLLKQQLVEPTEFDAGNNPLFSEAELHRAARYAAAVRKKRLNK
jgi:hypothetical protein